MNKKPVMEKIPTINQVLNRLPRAQVDYIKVTKEDLRKAIIEFTKLHLKAQAEAIHDKADIIFAPFTICSECGNGDPSIDGNSIDNAYPLDKVK